MKTARNWVLLGVMALGSALMMACSSGGCCGCDASPCGASSPCDPCGGGSNWDAAPAPMMQAPAPMMEAPAAGGSCGAGSS